MVLYVVNKLKFFALISIIVIGFLVISFDSVMQVVIKRLTQLLIQEVLHSLDFGSKPSCLSSSSLTNKTSLIIFISHPVSLIILVMISENQLF